MHKKLIMACMVLAAFTACGVAATSASAAPVITHPTGTVLAAGSSVTATNVGNVHFTTPIGSITCDHADLSGTVHTNSTAGGSKIEITSASFNGTGTGTDCTGPGSDTTKVTVTGLPWCRESTGPNDTFVLRGGGCTAVPSNITFTLHLTTATVSCGYSRTSLSGTFTTHFSGEGEKGTVSNENVKKSSGGFLCPSEGNLDMTLAWETTDGTPLYASS